MLGEPKKQFSLTRAALSTGGGAKSEFLSVNGAMISITTLAQKVIKKATQASDFLLPSLKSYPLYLFALNDTKFDFKFVSLTTAIALFTVEALGQQAILTKKGTLDQPLEDRGVTITWNGITQVPKGTNVAYPYVGNFTLSQTGNSRITYLQLDGSSFQTNSRIPSVVIDTFYIRPTNNAPPVRIAKILSNNDSTLAALKPVPTTISLEHPAKIAVPMYNQTTVVKVFLLRHPSGGSNFEFTIDNWNELTRAALSTGGGAKSEFLSVK